jgi:hypothetical protein
MLAGPWEMQTSGRRVMTGHLLVAEETTVAATRAILGTVNALLYVRFQIGHTTFQFEV